MRPFFIQRDQARLFGSYHQPAGDRPRTCGVVLCYPLGQEYIRAHRCFLQLAERLAREGFPSLRFEYVGCGDSSGDVQDWSIQAWTEDIEAAGSKLKTLAGVSRVCLIGLRLGASLALIASPRCSGLSGLVLWRPIVRGRLLMEALKREHRRWLRGSFARSPAKEPNEVELLGFTFPSQILQDLESLDLERNCSTPPRRVLLLNNSDEGLARVLRDQGSHVDEIQVEEPDFWKKHEDEEEKGLVPIRSLKVIAAWLDEEFPRYPGGRLADESPDVRRPSDVV